MVNKDFQFLLVSVILPTGTYLPKSGDDLGWEADHRSGVAPATRQRPVSWSFTKLS